MTDQESSAGIKCMYCDDVHDSQFICDAMFKAHSPHVHVPSAAGPDAHPTPVVKLRVRLPFSCSNKLLRAMTENDDVILAINEVQGFYENALAAKTAELEAERAAHALIERAHQDYLASERTAREQAERQVTSERATLNNIRVCLEATEQRLAAVEAQLAGVVEQCAKEAYARLIQIFGSDNELIAEQMRDYIRALADPAAPKLRLPHRDDPATWPVTHVLKAEPVQPICFHTLKEGETDDQGYRLPAGRYGLYPATMKLYASPPVGGPKQEPFAWVIPGDDNANANGFLDAMCYKHGEFTKPLYASPQPDEKADAERYRWLRDNYGVVVDPDGGHTYYLMSNLNTLDAAIDAARAAEKERK